MIDAGFNPERGLRLFQPPTIYEHMEQATIVTVHVSFDHLRPESFMEDVFTYVFNCGFAKHIAAAATVEMTDVEVLSVDLSTAEIATAIAFRGSEQKTTTFADALHKSRCATHCLLCCTQSDMW
jgi:hypothetical protein